MMAVPDVREQEKVHSLQKHISVWAHALQDINSFPLWVMNGAKKKKKQPTNEQITPSVSQSNPFQISRKALQNTKKKKVMWVILHWILS